MVLAHHRPDRVDTSPPDHPSPRAFDVPFDRVGRQGHGSIVAFEGLRVAPQDAEGTCTQIIERIGAARVEVVCLEQPDEMPAWDEEVRAAAAEGVTFSHGWVIRAFEGDGALSVVGLKRCTRVFDAQGRFDPRYDETTD